MSNDSGHVFGIVMRVSSLKEVFCSGDSCCLGQVTGPKEEVVVVKMVVWMVWWEVLTNLVVWIEVVLLVLPLVRGWGLPPLPFHPGFTMSQLKSFASWETVTYRQMGTCFAARF